MLAGEALHHLATANSVDVRRRVTPLFGPIALAVAAGAQPAGDGIADVVSADGSPRWLDGGSIEFLDPIADVAVVHRVALEHGSLDPFRTNARRRRSSPPTSSPRSPTPAGRRGSSPRPARGKTRVLTERARHLLRRWSLPPAAVTPRRLQQAGPGGDARAHQPTCPGCRSAR